MSNTIANILIINGVNLACLGTREIDVYGKVSFSEYYEELKRRFDNVEISVYQSDLEGEIATKISQTKNVDAIILNAGAYTHSSLVIADAISSTSVPVIEVHISNIFGRENYRKNSRISSVCTGFISGFGLQSYDLAIESIIIKKDIKPFEIK